MSTRITIPESETQDRPPFSALEYACEDVFSTLLFLRADASGQDSESAKGHLLDAIQSMQRQALACHESEEAVDLARYALAALADETMATKIPAWNSELARELFSDNRAGEGFFTRAKQIIVQQTRPDLARIYAMCLAFGFRGEFAVRNPDGLDQIHQNLSTLGDNATVSLSAMAERPAEAFPKEKSPLSPVWYASIFACFALIFAVTLSFQLDRQSAQIASWLNTQTPESSPTNALAR